HDVVFNPLHVASMTSFLLNQGKQRSKEFMTDRMNRINRVIQIKDDGLFAHESFGLVSYCWEKLALLRGWLPSATPTFSVIPPVRISYHGVCNDEQIYTCTYAKSR